MILPETHPLYGAVETVAEQICQNVFGRNLDYFRSLGSDDTVLDIETKAIGIICALESAGYRVVGPEPTEAELVAGLRAGNPLGELKDWQRQGFDDSTNTRAEMADVLRAAIAAAPTITEAEKGHG